MNVNQIKTIFLILAARGTHAGSCPISLGEACYFDPIDGDCCIDSSCDEIGSYECRFPLGEQCDASSSDQCFQGEFGVWKYLPHDMLLSIFLAAAA